MAEFQRRPIPVLETERLLLRKATMADAPRIQKLFANANVLKYMHAGIPWPYPEDGAVEFLGRTLPKVDAEEEYYWVIVEKEHRKDGLIGVISLTPGSDEDSRGFWLAEHYWGRGYMGEAVAAVTDFGFRELKMPYMLLNNAEPNVASHRLKEKAGAEIIGIEDRNYVGGTFPGVRWKLTAEAWEKHRDRFLED
jgi:RimJ/RimL family protein N-acetyltransferase